MGTNMMPSLDAPFELSSPTDDGEMFADALFDLDRTHRFRLTRVWDRAEAMLNFIMLNPSTADEKVLDPTIKGCIRRARRMGMGGVVVTNLFSFRSTKPQNLYGMPYEDAVGDGNDWHILDVARHTLAMGGMVICGWGAHGALHERGATVLSMLEIAEAPLHVLAVNSGGTPKHPLYIADDVIPMPWKWVKASDAKPA